VLASAATSAADQLARTGDGALMPRAPPSWRTAVLTMIKRYGVISFLTLLLGYGYIRFRQRVEEQMVIKRRLQQVQSRARRSTKIQGMLSLISDQQAQYQQVSGAQHIRSIAIFAHLQCETSALYVRIFLVSHRRCCCFKSA
jgi:hypothetical protein